MTRLNFKMNYLHIRLKRQASDNAASPNSAHVLGSGTGLAEKKIESKYRFPDPGNPEIEVIFNSTFWLAN